MDMYWPQREVFFIATLALFPEKVKEMRLVPATWWRYFDCKDFEQLTHQLAKYEEADYIEFDTNFQNVMYIGIADAPNVHRVPEFLQIKTIYSEKVSRARSTIGYGYARCYR